MSTTTIAGEDTSGNLRAVAVGETGQLVVAALMGENSTDDRLYGGNAPASATAKAANAVIKASAGKYYGYIVTTATATGAITIYDNASTNSGMVIDVIPVSTAAGTRGILASPVPCSSGMYAYFSTSTGTIVFLYT